MNAKLDWHFLHRQRCVSAYDLGASWPHLAFWYTIPIGKNGV